MSSGLDAECVYTRVGKRTGYVVVQTPAEEGTVLYGSPSDWQHGCKSAPAAGHTLSCCTADPAPRCLQSLGYSLLAVSRVCSFMAKPTEQSYTGAKRILAWLRDRSELGCTYGRPQLRSLEDLIPSQDPSSHARLA